MGLYPPPIYSFLYKIDLCVHSTHHIPFKVKKKIVCEHKHSFCLKGHDLLCVWCVYKIKKKENQRDSNERKKYMKE